MRAKKSQITLFVIVGLLLVIILLLFYFYMNKPKIDIDIENRNIQDFEQSKSSIESYTKDCLGAVTEKAIKKYGTINSDIAISRFIDMHIMECLNNYEEFREKGYDLNYESPKINTSSTSQEVRVSMDFEITLADATQRSVIAGFNYDYKIPEGFVQPNQGFDWIYDGILLKEEVISEPRINKVWIVKVDLDNPNISFIVTPKISPRLMVTSDFLRQYRVQLATNAGLYDTSPPFEVTGYSMYQRDVYSKPDIKPDVTLFISSDNKLSMKKKIPDLEYAVTGQNRVVEKHEPAERLDPNHPLHKDSYDVLHPRTAYGIDEEYNWFLIVVVDGRQPGVSEGLSLMELADLFLENNADEAINMDGGGSTTIVTEDRGVLNTPSDGEERPVANHLGIYALPLESIEPQQGEEGQLEAPVYGPGNPAPDDPSIVNFHIVSPGIARGGQPSRAGYEWLLAQGYTTVIDLQGYDNSDKIPVGMTYLRYPMHGDMPVETLTVMSQSIIPLLTSKQPVYVHCQWGSHRTGMIVAIYRMTQEGWGYDQTYSEMMLYADNYFPYTNLIDTVKNFS